MSIRKKIGITSLVMINLAALGGIRSWAPIAESGATSLFFFALAMVGFFIPLSLISADLAVKMPQSGGVYAWVKKAFGHKWGFLAIWLLWIENVIWYPTVLSFIAATLSYAVNPGLASNSVYNVSLILVIFWGTTLLSLFGIQISNWMSALGAICGTFIPSILIITLGLVWYYSGLSLQIAFDLKSIIPNLSSPQELALLSGVMISLLGMEMSAIHAGDVQDPHRTYPKAILYSSLIVALFSVLGVLGIAIVVPHSDLLMNAGCLQAFSLFLHEFHLSWLVPIMAVMVALGALGSMSTWIVGPCKGLLTAAENGDLPLALSRVNQFGMPKNLILLQAGLVSILALVFLMMPSINSAYWMLMVLTTQLYLLMYLLLFSAAIKLRAAETDPLQQSLIPGGKWGTYSMAALGLISSSFALMIAFVPPPQISSSESVGYISFLVISMLLLSVIPFMISRKRTKAINVVEELES